MEICQVSQENKIVPLSSGVLIRYYLIIGDGIYHNLSDMKATPLSYGVSKYKVASQKTRKRKVRMKFDKTDK